MRDPQRLQSERLALAEIQDLKEKILNDRWSWKQVKKRLERVAGLLEDIETARRLKVALGEGKTPHENENDILNPIQPCVND
jgi:hypothetical protein